MKVTQILLSIIAVGIALSLQTGCLKSKERAQRPLPIEPEQGTAKKAPSTPGRSTKGAVLHVDNAVFDMGRIGPAKRITCEFAFSNAGTETLHIKKILSPCRCTVVQLEKKDYAPGESGNIVVYYRSASREMSVEKFAHIISNDKANPKYELTLKGRIEYTVQVLPAKNDLFLNQDNAGIKPITLKSKDGAPFAITSFTSSNNVITAQFDPAEKKTRFVLNPKVDVNKLKKNLTGSIRIGLSHPDTRQVNLSYQAQPLYVVTPGRLILQNAQPGNLVEKYVWIRSNYSDKVEIESIASTKGYMQVIEQKHQGKSVKLLIRITPPSHEGKTRRYLSDRLIIKTADGEQLTLTMSGWYAV